MVSLRLQDTLLSEIKGCMLVLQVFLGAGDLNIYLLPTKILDVILNKGLDGVIVCYARKAFQPEFVSCFFFIYFPF